MPLELSVLGLKRGTVQVVSYNPAWPELFLAEQRRLQLALGVDSSLIVHVGSTAVPGLAAKPIIDILVAIDDLADYERYIPLLADLGYTFMPERVFADRVFLPKGLPERRTHHLSLVAKDSPAWRDPIRFRDMLRADPGVRQAYQALKEQLAAEHSDDRASYTAAKAAFIERILDKEEA